ncbi:hypothetical protein E0Z10_g10562 [Xylaria hypoxylon]|uniref:N-acetyltransferase domain-containing protein n=1 Tax=Xylaria hypoxylon TaxID=37992 RepID=A0A4Z0YKP2_9PEZI|nr:hypothetical protein E0Z10_g10562 [Xylaria hypoxylon]
MQDDVDSSEKSSPTLTSISLPENASMIRSACEGDMEAIIEVETTSFPQVYTDVDDLAHCRRRELEGGYPCYRILAASSECGDQSAIHGLVIFESYLRSYKEYRDAETGEGITLPANRPPDKKPAYNILMAATRADPALLDDEFLFVSEICIHPHMRERGNGTRLMRHIVDVANVLAVKIIVLVEGSVSDAAQQWTADEAEEVNAVELAALKEREQRTTMSFYGKLGFKKRAYFFWGRRDCAIPRIFNVMQYPAYR